MKEVRILDNDMRKMRKKFVKDTKIPIPVLDDPYFDYFLDLYEGSYGAKRGYEEFINQVENEGGWEAYRKIYDSFKDQVIEHVKEKDSYREFIGREMTPIIKRGYSFEKGGFYKKLNTGARWLSVDLKTANFYSMKVENEDLVDGFDSYEGWISSFDGGENFKGSKSIRQVVFGNLNPKRQQKIQEAALHAMIQDTEDHVGVEGLYIMGSDEFIIHYNDDLKDWIVNQKDEWKEKTGFVVEVKDFFLRKIGESEDLGYVLEYENGDSEFKGVNKHFFAQSYKKYWNESLREEDFLFEFEGMVAVFKEEKK